ncbi:MAG TPA: hypothetical protein VL334_09905 [Anaerolineae bacterium]|nr:hypothetical protein [Anaerolineae bacterium]
MPTLLFRTLANYSPLLPWVLASMAWYALATVALWLALRRSGPEGVLSSLLGSIPGQLALWLTRLLWLIGPGYAALLLGILSPRLMGLSQVELGWSLGSGLLFAAGALALLLAAGLSYRRTHPAQPPYLTLSHGIALTVLLLMEAGALQWQWAFYRSALIEALTSAAAPAPIYWGTWLAVGVLVVQGALSPWLWHDLRKAGLAERRVLRAALLAVSSVLYLLSRNFWLAWALHGAASAILEPRVVQRQARGILLRNDNEAPGA